MSRPINIPNTSSNSESDSTSSSTSLSPVDLIDKQRCLCCNKKLKLIEQISGTCKCGGVFCSKHKSIRNVSGDTNSHLCSLGAIKEIHKKRLELNNPKICMSRIQQI